jgi:hypothetical protein
LRFKKISAPSDPTFRQIQWYSRELSAKRGLVQASKCKIHKYTGKGR